MRLIVDVIDKISVGSAYLAIVANILILLLVLAEIAARTFFNTSLLIVHQTASWLLLASSFLGASWTLRNKGHVKIDIVVSKMSPRGRRWVEFTLAMIGVICFTLFSYFVWVEMIDKYSHKVTGDTIYRLPLWWSFVPFFLGSVVIALQFLGLALNDLIALKKTPKTDAKSPFMARLVPMLGIVVLVVILSVKFVPGMDELGGVALLAITLVILFAMILGGMWVFLTLGLTGVIALMLFTSYPVGPLVMQAAYFSCSNFVLICLPLFIFMGEMLFCSGASNDLYSGITPWVEKIPGRLLHSNILSCTIFAAVSGSSAVTTATIGSVAVPELKKRGYDEGITLGSLAGAGTLGLLIPPSIILIIYGAITTESIGQLFVAGVVPGIFISFLFMGYIWIRSLKYPNIAPPGNYNYSWKERIQSTIRLVPIVTVVSLVLGLIYAGVSTPTEAGAIGAFCAIALTILYGKCTMAVLKKALFATIKTTSMIMLVITFAAVLSSCIAYLRIPQELASALVAADLSKYLVLAVLCVIFLALGCLFDGASMMVLTLPIVYPMIIKMGFNGIWFGIVLTILIEVAQITPPVGFNLYVLQNISGASIEKIVRNTMPFFFLMCLAILILIIFPEIVMTLPNMMAGR